MTVRTTLISSLAAVLLAGAAYAGLSGGVFAASETVEQAVVQSAPTIRVVPCRKA